MGLAGPQSVNLPKGGDLREKEGWHSSRAASLGAHLGVLPLTATAIRALAFVASVFQSEGCLMAQVWYQLISVDIENRACVCVCVCAHPIGRE